MTDQKGMILFDLRMENGNPTIKKYELTDDGNKLFSMLSYLETT